MSSARAMRRCLADVAARRESHGRRPPGWRSVLLGVALLELAVSCSFDKADRWIARPLSNDDPVAALCEPGSVRCTSAFERCSDAVPGGSWEVVDDCAARG